MKTKRTVTNMYGYLTMIGNVDEHGNSVIRTKREYPYSYDGFVTWRGGDNKEANDTIYSDRLLQWDYEKQNRLSEKYFGKS